jgi:hypothetical protein
MAKPTQDPPPATTIADPAPPADRALQLKATLDKLPPEDLQELRKLLAPAVGDVLDSTATHETVVIRRPKAARPTGRYVGEANYKFGDARILVDQDGKQLPKPTVIRAGEIVEAGDTPPAIPQHVIDSAMASGALREELA